jgi:hypothetical protein
MLDPLPKACSLRRDGVTPIPFTSTDETKRPGSVFAGLRVIDGLKDFISEIDEYLTKFTFDKTPLEIWQHKYKKCPNSNSSFINQNDKKITSYVNKVITHYPSRKSEQIITLLGETGSGKSSFNKYITTFFHDKFKVNSMITCRIEFSKLIKYVEARSEGERNNGGILHRQGLKRLVLQYIETCLTRDLLHSLYSKQNLSGSGEPFLSSDLNELPESFKFLDISNDNNRNNFIESINRSLKASVTLPDVPKQATDIANSVTEILNFYQSKSRDGRRKLFRTMRGYDYSEAPIDYIGPASLKNLSYFLSYAIIGPVKIIPFIIIDGMDYIDVSDFIMDDNLVHSVLEIVSDIVNKDQNRFKITNTGEDFSPILQISMRSNTMEVFWQHRRASIEKMANGHLEKCRFSADIAV